MQGFNEWLTSTALSQAIQTHFWVIPTLQIIHILFLAVLFTTSMLLTLRVFNAAWREESAGVLANRYSRVLWTCIPALLLTGALLITAEPGRTLTNISFYAKMIMLAVALVLTITIISAARRSTLGGAHRGMAVVTLLLWAAIIVAGRYIAYT